MNTIRKSGLDIIGNVPWGFHFAVAYNNVSDLKDILTPYLTVGLEANERCIVTISDIFAKNECEKMLKKSMPGFNRYYKKGQLEIVPYAEWYIQDGKFNKKKAINSVITRLEASKNAGYEGLRIFFEASWKKRIKESEVISYEKSVQKKIRKTQIIALCGYLTKNFSMDEALHVVCVHDNILVKKNGEWVMIKCFKSHSLQSEFGKLKQVLYGVNETGDSYKGNTDLFKTIREQIRVTRKTMGLTQAEIAHRVKISPNFLGLIERGERMVSFKTMAKIASALGLNLKELVGEIKIAPKVKNKTTGKIESYLEGCTPREKKLIYGFIRLLAKERSG